MAAKLEEITARYLRERMRFENADGDTVIAEAWMNSETNAAVTIKGQADIDELRADQTYRFYGRWQNYKNKRSGLNEKQFHFQSFVADKPHGREGVVSYLVAAGEGLGFGVQRAAKCWEIFGTDAVKACRESPEAVFEALRQNGLRTTLEVLRKVADELESKAKLEDCTLAVMDILAGQGFRKSIPRMVIKEKGNLAAHAIRKNPFCLLKYPGAGFKLCDALWSHLGLPRKSLRRQAYCAWNAVFSDRDGSTWMARSQVEAVVAREIGDTPNKIDKAIRLAIRAKLLDQCKTAGINGPISPNGTIAWLAVDANAKAEQRLAGFIADAVREPCRWPSVDLVANIDREQPEVLSLALQGPIAILGGRPGAGKTFVAANLIRTLIQEFGAGSIGIAAPTNLAAQRLNLAMAEYKVGIRATTNNRLLGMPKRRGKKWNHDETNKLPFKVLVFDEESMKNTDMMCDIFAARAPGTHVLLIGDINQLPPIEHGAPLRDMIAAGLPYGELTEIRRNSGGIVEACAAIAEGRRWGAGDNLEIIEVDAEDEQQDCVLAKLRECKEAGFDPVWDSRVIVPKNETRRSFNRLLQRELNPNPGVAGSPFAVADKVICRSNDDFKIVEVDTTSADSEDVEYSDSGNEVKVANGELGRVLSIHDSFFIIEVFCPRRVVKVPRKSITVADDSAGGRGGGGDEREDKTGTGCSFELAYAVTFHSSQGSEFPWPILVASSRDGFMGSRELVYTGISRGKAKAKLIGRKAIWDKFCRTVALNKRKTLLKERILLAKAENELAEL